MTFAIATWQQAVGTAAFFFIGAFFWHIGVWAAGKLVSRVG